MAAVLVSVAASAQQNAASKRLESNFQLGGGLFLKADIWPVRRTPEPCSVYPMASISDSTTSGR